MLRIPTKPARDYPWYLRPFFWNQRRKYGAVLDAALLWARAGTPCKQEAAARVCYGKQSAMAASEPRSTP